MKQRILVVEDEDKLRRVIALHLAAEGWEVDEASSAEHALPKAASAAFILTDLKLPGLSGIDLLRGLRERNARAPVVLMTAFGTIENAVEAMKEGATDFLLKPFSLDQLSAVLNKAREVQALRDENTRLRDQLDQRYRFDQIIAAAPSMQEALQAALRVAPARSTVLLCGESGVGKDLLARAIHHHSPRRDQPFVKINCTAIPENLLESELFGYEKGAFTGASVTKPGKFEQADSGTVFLDEIGDVPADDPGQTSARSSRSASSSGWAATAAGRWTSAWSPPPTSICARRSRPARSARISTTASTCSRSRFPPLRERREDIPLLAEQFLRRVSRRTRGRRDRHFSGGPRKLVDWQWPGNVRELENVIERSVLLAAGTVLQPGDIRLDAVRNHSSPATSGFLPEGVTLEQHEQDLIREALRRADGNKSQAARLLGLTRNALRYRLSQMGLE